jgi:hypothetical protein
VTNQDLEAQAREWIPAHPSTHNQILAIKVKDKMERELHPMNSPDSLEEKARRLTQLFADEYVADECEVELLKAFRHIESDTYRKAALTVWDVPTPTWDDKTFSAHDLKAAIAADLRKLADQPTEAIDKGEQDGH